MSEIRTAAIVLVLSVLVGLPACAVNLTGRTRTEFSSEQHVDALIRALKHQDFAVRRDAARALGRIGAPARRAIPALCTATQDNIECVRLASQEAMERIDSLSRQEDD